MSRSFLHLFILPFLSAGIFSCDPKDPQRIVDKAIETHGGKKFERVKIEFDFRGRHYTSTREEGIYTYTREFTDSVGRIKDVLSNEGFHREINGGLAKITEERAKAYSNSVNAVIYFALLPFGLNDRAVRKSYVDTTTIKGKSYHLIRITFDQEGGGKDFEDVFLFWINQENYQVDYFAYSYETDGGGIRFREAINSRIVGGILFQDYNNYQPKADSGTLEQMQDLFETNQLEKLSVIKLENLEVADI